MHTLARKIFLGPSLAALVVCATLTPAYACGVPPGGSPSCSSGSGSQSSPNPNTGAGNPIDFTTGNKYQQEIDVEATDDLSADFRRHYNSSKTLPGSMGAGWSGSYDTKLSRREFLGTGTIKPSQPQITITQGDGREIHFDPIGTTPTVRRYGSTPLGYGIIEENLAALQHLRESKTQSSMVSTEQPVWTLKAADGATLTFDGRGLLKSIAHVDGRTLALQFDIQRRFSKVSDSYGNSLTAAYWDDGAERLESYDGAGKPGSRTNVRGNGYRGRLKALVSSNGDRIQYEYDAHGNLNDVVYADGTARRYEYARVGDRDLLAKIFGRDGNLFASYEYDARGHAIGSTHPDHRDDVKLSYQWPTAKSPVGHTEVEAFDGSKTLYTWRADPDAETPVIVKADGPGCRTCSPGNVRYEYDSHQRETVTIQVDSSGVPIEQRAITLDAIGRTVSVELARFVEGRRQAAYWRETREYAGDNFLPTMISRPSVVAGREHTLHIDYNALGQPIKIVEHGFQFAEPQGLMNVSTDSAPAVSLERTTTLSYAAVHGLSLLRSIDGPLAGANDTWTYRYDAAGRLQAIEHPLELTEKFERDARGRIVAHTGLDAVRESLKYGADGNISRVGRGDQWMNLHYDAAGRVDAMTDSLGQQLLLTHDDSGQLVQVGDPAGNRIHWNYSANGAIQNLSLLNPDGSVSQRGQPSAVIEDIHARAPLADETMLSSLAGALPDQAAQAIPLQREAPANAVPNAFHPLGIQTAYDARRRATLSVYDDFGRVTAQRSPVTGLTYFRWDESDHLIEKRTADGSSTLITRDALGRAVRLHAGVEDGRIEWGNANRPIRVTFAAGEERFEYDRQARLISHVLAVDGHEFRIAYDFDQLGRILRKHLPDGSVLRYQYNGLSSAKPGVLNAIYKEGAIDRPIISGLNGSEERYADREFTFGNGLTQRTLLDMDGRAIRVGNSQVGESHLDWTKASGATVSYSRSTQAGGTAAADLAPSLTDRFASRLSQFGHGDADVTGALDALAQPYAAVAITVDAKGELLEDAQRHYDWDALGRLIRVSKREDYKFMRASTNQADAVSNIIAEYRYNLFGERIAKLVHTATGSEVTYFMWDGAELAAEMDRSGKSLRDYVYLAGRPVAMLAGNAIFAIHTDHRFAPVAVTDSERHVVWQADIADNGAATVLTGSHIQLPLRASNQYFDSETGLHYNLYRYLDATQGRYISPDPLGLAAGPDLYRFALGQPHTLIDPLGLQTVSPTTDITSWSYGKKLTAVFTMAAKTLPADLGNELLNLVSVKNVASTVAIFSLWAVSHAYGAGELFDAAALAVMYFTIGSQAITIIQGLVAAALAINSAKCYSDLTAPANSVSKALAAGTSAFIQATVLKKLFGSAEENVGSKGMQELENETGNAQGATFKTTEPTTTLDALIDEELNGKPVSVASNASTTTIGNLGEEVTADILQQQTGLTYKGIFNASNNGPDLVAINDANKTIVHIEVKSSTVGKPAWPKGDLNAQFQAWISEAESGTIAGKPVSAADQAYAKQIATLMKEGYTVVNKVSQVDLPGKGSVGVPTATIQNWP